VTGFLVALAYLLCVTVGVAAVWRATRRDDFPEAHRRERALSVLERMQDHDQP